MKELKVLKGGDEKGGHSDHLSKNRDSLGQEYGLSGSSVARLFQVNQLIPEIKEILDQGNMQLMAAVQLSYLPEQAQKLAMEASKKSGVAINKDIAVKVRKAPMTEKAILEAIAGKQPGAWRSRRKACAEANQIVCRYQRKVFSGYRSERGGSDYR